MAELRILDYETPHPPPVSWGKASCRQARHAFLLGIGCTLGSGLCLVTMATVDQQVLILRSASGGCFIHLALLGWLVSAMFCLFGMAKGLTGLFCDESPRHAAWGLAANAAILVAIGALVVMLVLCGIAPR